MNKNTSPYPDDIVDLFIDDIIIENGISKDIYEHFQYLKNNPNYFQPRTNCGLIGKNEALNNLLLDYITNYAFDILNKLSIDGKEITKNMHYFDENNKYVITFSIISEKDEYDGKYLIDFKLLDIKKI